MLLLTNCCHVSNVSDWKTVIPANANSVFYFYCAISAFNVANALFSKNKQKTSQQQETIGEVTTHLVVKTNKYMLH